MENSHWLPKSLNDDEKGHCHRSTGISSMGCRMRLIGRIFTGRLSAEHGFTSHPNSNRGEALN